MRRLAWLLLFLVAVPCVAQSYPDVDALIDLAFATDPSVVAKHLPVQLVDALQQLPPNDQMEFERGLMLTEKMKGERVVLKRSDTPPTLIEVRKDGDATEEVGNVLLDKRISDGYESLLRLKFKTSSRDIPEDAALLVWMRLEEGEWRLVEIQPSEARDRFNFADTSMLDKFRARKAPDSEAAAIASLRTYNTALVTYSGAYPEVGFAPRLDALGGTDPENTDSGHAALVDPTLTTEPFEKSGYRFTYRPAIQDGKTMAYTLIGRPMNYGPGSKRSFFTDESGVIRSTEEDREPTAADPPLQ